MNVRYRTIWIRDVPLGTRQCDADALLLFLVLGLYDGRLEVIHRTVVTSTNVQAVVTT